MRPSGSKALGQESGFSFSLAPMQASMENGDSLEFRVLGQGGDALKA